MCLDEPKAHLKNIEIIIIKFLEKKPSSTAIKYFWKRYIILGLTEFINSLSFHLLSQSNLYQNKQHCLNYQ